MEIRTVTPDQKGTWFEGSSTRSADQLSERIVSVAIPYGWADSDSEDLVSVLDSPHSWDGAWLASPTDREWLDDATDRAIDYLNEIAPAGYRFEREDGFYLLPVCATQDYDPEFDGPCPHEDSYQH